MNRWHISAIITCGILAILIIGTRTIIRGVRVNQVSLSPKPRPIAEGSSRIQESGEIPVCASESLPNLLIQSDAGLWRDWITACADVELFISKYKMNAEEAATWQRVLWNLVHTEHSDAVARLILQRYSIPEIWGKDTQLQVVNKAGVISYLGEIRTEFSRRLLHEFIVDEGAPERYAKDWIRRPLNKYSAPFENVTDHHAGQDYRMIVALVRGYASKGAIIDGSPSLALDVRTLHEELVGRLQEIESDASIVEGNRPYKYSLDITLDGIIIDALSMGDFIAKYGMDALKTEKGLEALAAYQQGNLPRYSHWFKKSE